MNCYSATNFFLGFWIATGRNVLASVLVMVIAILVSLPPAIARADQPLPRSVLVITQSSPSSAGAIAIFAALRSDPNINSTSRVAVYTEHLDLNLFSSPQYRLQTRNYLREKYRETQIGVVIVDGPVALDLVLGWRGEMWSNVPVIFFGLDEVTAAQLKLSPNVTGIVAHQTFQGMVNTDGAWLQTGRVGRRSAGTRHLQA
jgi:hypothetical protein